MCRCCLKELYAAPPFSISTFQLDRTETMMTERTTRHRRTAVPDDSNARSPAERIAYQARLWGRPKVRPRQVHSELRLHLKSGETESGRVRSRRSRAGIRLRHWLACGSILTLFAACGSSDESDAPKSGSKLGPECEKQYGSGGCCLETAGNQQVAKDACAAAKKSTEDAIAGGRDPSLLESGCKAANDSAKAAGKCTGGSDGGSGSDGGTGSAKLGPKCTEYFATCCEPSEGAANCAQFKEDTLNALKLGADPTQMEDACDVSINEAKSAGHC